MGGNMSSNQYPPPPNIIYYFPGVNEDIINFFPTAADPVPSNPNKEAAASRDPSPSPADQLLPHSEEKEKEAISDIPSPSSADNILPCSAEKNETPSPSPPADNVLPGDEETCRYTPPPTTDDLSRDNILKKKETCRDDTSTPTTDDLSRDEKKETCRYTPTTDDLGRPRVGIFTDFGKQARDILNKYYYNSSSNPNNKEIFFGLGRSSSHADFLFTAYPFSEYPEVEEEEEGFYLGEFSAAHSNDRNNSIEIKTNAELNGFSTHVVSEIVPKTLNGFMDMKFPDLDGTSKVGIQYLFPPYGTLTAATFTSTNLKDNLSTFHYSGTIGYGRVSMGGDFVICDPNSSNTYVDVKDYSCGIRFVNSDFDGTIGFTDKGDTWSASCVHYVDEMKKSCAVAEFKRNLSTNENTLTIGGTMERKYNTKTTLLKAKVDNHGKMGVVLQQQLFKDTKIRICGEFDHKNLDLNKTPMIGLSLIL